MSTKGSAYQDGEDQMAGLGAALDEFHKGVQGLQQGMALKNANQQVQQIKSSMIKDEEKQAALSQVAQQMVFQLNASGADPNRIKQMFDVISPPKETIQSIDQALFSSSATTRARGESAKKQEQDFELKKAGLSGSRQMNMADYRDALGQQKEIRTELFKTQQTYGKETRDIDKAARQATTALTVLNGKGDIEKMAKSVIPTLLARGSGEVGNLTEMERSVFEGRQDVASLLSRYKEGKLTGKLTDGDKTALRAVAEVYVQNAKEMKKARAHLYTGQLSASHGLEPNELIKKISGGTISSYEDPNAQEAAPEAPQSSGIDLNNYRIGK